MNSTPVIVVSTVACVALAAYLYYEYYIKNHLNKVQIALDSCNDHHRKKKLRKNIVDPAKQSLLGSGYGYYSDEPEQVPKQPLKMADDPATIARLKEIYKCEPKLDA